MCPGEQTGLTLWSSNSGDDQRGGTFVSYEEWSQRRYSGPVWWRYSSERSPSPVTVTTRQGW